MYFPLVYMSSMKNGGKSNSHLDIIPLYIWGLSTLSGTDTRARIYYVYIVCLTKCPRAVTFQLHIYTYTRRES